MFREHSQLRIPSTTPSSAETERRTQSKTRRGRRRPSLGRKHGTDHGKAHCENILFYRTPSFFRRFALLCLFLLCICGCHWVADGVAQAPPPRAHIYTLVGGELETSQIRGGSWDKKPRKEEECVFQQRGDVMTCDLELSQRFYESAATRSGSVGNDRHEKENQRIF